MVDYHLVVLVHGIWGNLGHMNYLAEQISEQCIPQNSSEKLYVHKARSHSGELTYDGIDVNGKRISDEILEMARAISSPSSRVTKFSLIGYSMGGLVSRYALGILYHEGFFDKVQPVHFVTFCTPHVGILNSSQTFSSRIYNALTPYLLASTGSQLFLTDRKVVCGKDYFPLLQWMTNPSSKFYQSLKLFKSRTLYANTINDRRTSWYTAFVSAFDPFNSMVNEALSAYSLQYVEGYEPTIVDFSKPIEFNRICHEKPPRVSIGRITYKSLVWLKVLGSFVLLAPIYALYVIFKSIRQRVTIRMRIKKFARESAEGLKALYQAATHDDHNPSKVSFDNKYESESDDEIVKISDRVYDQTETFVDSVYSALNSASYYDYHHSVTKADDTKTMEKEPLKSRGPVTLKGKAAAPNFKVNLTESQQQIVENFNKLGWTKFPVIIRHTKATHAAIIYRQDDPDFEEGKLVVRHFINQVFTV